MKRFIKEKNMSIATYEELNSEQLNLIKSQICKGATDDELKLFIYTAKRAGIDPLLKQIYAVRRGGQMVIQMGIDGFRAVASKQGDYLPGDESFEYDNEGNLLAATVTIYKIMPNGTPHKFSKTAYWVEFAQYQYNKSTGKKELSQFWKQYPRVMLAKCAEASGLRKGWPHVFGKIYEPGELNAAVEASEQTESVIEISGKEASKEMVINLSIPEGIEPSKVDQYLELVSEEFKKPVDFFKRRATQSPDEFWQQFHKWEARQENQELVNV